MSFLTPAWIAVMCALSFVAFLIMLCGEFLKTRNYGPSMPMIDIVLGGILCVLIVVAWLITTWKGGLAALGGTFLAACVARPLAIRCHSWMVRNRI